MQGYSFLGIYSYGQTPEGIPAATQNQDSSVIVSDTSDTLAISDTTDNADSVRVPVKGDIETSIVYSAEDSIIMDVSNKLVYLYGNAKIDYGEISLTAGEIEINWGTNMMTAKPATDSSGKKVGIPVFKDGPDTYVVQNYVKYNFKTRKGISSGVITQQGEGFIHGEKIKRVEENLYISSAQYTTCNLAHPHFFIQARKLKVIPEDKIVSGPFNLVISDVQTPFGFFLGYFPIPKKEKSGIIFPTFGSSNRGFFLRDGGFYLALNDHVGIKLLGDGYTNGSYRGGVQMDYYKRYRFQGNLAASFSKFVSGFDEREEPVRDFNVSWHHNTKRNSNSSLSANVNAGTSGYYKRNSYNPTAYQTGTFRSGITYYKNFGNTPFNLNVGLEQEQNINTRVVSFNSLPQVAFNMNKIYPFQRRNAVGKKRFYEMINLSYNMNARVSVTNDTNVVRSDSVLSFNRKNLPLILSKARFGARHTVPVAMPLKFNRSFLKYFVITPNFLYDEYWYQYKLDYKFDPSLNRTIADTTFGFTRAYSYSGGVNVSTNIYGMYKFPSKKLLGIRHTLIPNVGFYYKPDFTQGNYQFVQINDQGNFSTLSRYGGGALYGAPTPGLSQSISFSLNNSFEAKVASRKDTVSGTKKFKLIDQLSLSGNYNFAAKRNHLSEIQANARTVLFERFDIYTTAVFDPYILNAAGNRSDTFAIESKKGLARLTRYNVSVGANLNPKARQKAYKSDKGSDIENQIINANPYAYVDFNIPWTLHVSYNLNYTRGGILPGNFSQALTFYGDIKLTDKWKVGFTSGYDFTLNQLTTTTIDIHRDLHCWQMALNFSPFAPIQFYGFSISAKSNILQDLRLNKRSPAMYGSFY